MKQTITKIYRSDKDKNGNLLKTKDGRPYTRVAIKTQKYGDRFISGFGGDWNENWQIGDSVNIKVEEVGEYLNFSKIDRLDELEARIKALEDYMLNQDRNPEEDNGHIEEINAENLPF